MCDGFGIIVTKDGRFLWIEPDKEGDVSHSEIISRAGLTEDHNPLESRKFVRIEFPDWTEGSFRFDENSSLPAWLDEDETKEKCIKVLLRVQPIWAEYHKVVDQARAEYHKVVDPAQVEYHKVIDPAQVEYHKVIDPARAEYDKVVDQAQAEYYKVVDQARAEYDKVVDQARAEYDKVVDPARAEYHKVVDPAQAEYDKVVDQALKNMISKMSKMTGYCSK